MNLVSIIAEADTAAHGEESGSFLVSPNVGLMLWTLIVFAISLYIMSKLVFPRIRDSLDKRQAAIDESIDTAARTKVEAEEILAEYRERLKEARVQAEEILNRARKAAETTEAAAIEAGKAKREEMLEQSKREIQAETRRAIQDIRNEVADLTIMATEKVTRKSLTEADQRRLVEEALSELDFSTLAGGREN